MEWSRDIYKFHDVLEHITLPCFVMVEGDYSSENRMQTFVSGDVLRIDKVTVKKCVSMLKVDLKTDALSDGFLVPLDFKTFVEHVVINTDKKYSFLHEILNDYPRFVKVNGTFKSPIGKVFTKGSQFEVLRVFGVNDEKRVLVNYDGKDMFLPAFTAGSFSPVEDEAVYFLKDFCNAPRFVRPLNLNFDAITTLFTRPLPEHDQTRGIDIGTTEHGTTIADIPEDRGVRRCTTDPILKVGKTGNRDKEENQEQRKLFNSSIAESFTSTETQSRGYSDSSQTPEYMNIPISVHCTQSAKTLTTNIFEKYSVGQLCNVLQRCELLYLATVCTEEKIDGYLFSRLQNEDFCKPPFNLNNLEIRKIREMVSGWRPNV
ncbi:hypothetical protein ScPMuIL_012344 [Solemya velum]